MCAFNIENNWSLAGLWGCLNRGKEVGETAPVCCPKQVVWSSMLGSRAFSPTGTVSLRYSTHGLALHIPFQYSLLPLRCFASQHIQWRSLLSWSRQYCGTCRSGRQCRARRARVNATGRISCADIATNNSHGRRTLPDIKQHVSALQARILQ